MASEVVTEPKTPTRRIIERLASRRNLLGWTHAKVAGLLHVVPATVRSWERGDRVPSHDTLVHWAYALGLQLRTTLSPMEDE